MAAGYPGGHNIYVPSHEASGGLITGFSRNPKKFPLLRYIKLIPVKKEVGYYLRITAEEAGRVVNLMDSVWPLGHEAPTGDENLESFQYSPYATTRRVYPYAIPTETVDQADWKVEVIMAGIQAAKAMTTRTKLVWNALTTAASWEGNTDTATNLGSGKWDAGSSTNLYIKNTFDAVSEAILKATLSVVQRADLVCVVNPATARKMSSSPEIRDYVKQTMGAIMIQRGEDESLVGEDRWGLPPVLYGIKMVIENTTVVTSAKGATRAASYVVPAGVAVFLARPGSLLGIEGIPEFSTAQMFSYEEMSAENKQDVDNRRYLGRFIDNFSTNLVAPASGYYVTACND